ncbi:MAG: TIR domain-containing protein [Anaerolineae bacterium]|nr:TIR domain-containing protein [Anaerolineae bacterium]MCA9888290.1 TIR domain-containing protein [Anaerolineae bacterium]MCA9893267.1 TIR domain-containing protein [Anaerolineae bacterium]MCB9461228.1 TIR domain-containing protein [Anaerolineaceae bacterium]
MANIFLSYSPKDQRFVAGLREVLVQIGHKPWIDPKPRPGQDWRLEIDDAIAVSDATIVVITPASAESIYTTYEWSRALALGKTVVVLIARPADMHPRLHSLEVFDMSGFTDVSHFWDYFVREMQRIFSVLPQTSGLGHPPDRRPPATEYIRVQMPEEPGLWIVVRRGPNLNEMFKLEKDVVTLGRDGANDIVIDDAEVSRFHLRFMRRGRSYGMEDVGSTNGTFVQNRRVDGLMNLTPGTAIRLGDSVIISFEMVR